MIKLSSLLSHGDQDRRQEGTAFDCVIANRTADKKGQPLIVSFSVFQSEAGRGSRDTEAA